MTPRPLAATLVPLAAVLACWTAGPQRSSPPRTTIQQSDSTIRLRSRAFTPRPGVDDRLGEYVRSLGAVDRVHVMLQFRATPTRAQRDELTRLGVRLLDPLPGLAFVASVPRNMAGRLPAGARWMGVIHPADKAPSGLLSDSVPARLVDTSGGVSLVVQFFGDVGLDDQRRVLARHGVGRPGRIGSMNAWTVVIPQRSIRGVVMEDGVQWIWEPPGRPEPDNDDVRGGVMGVQADVLSVPAYNLTGAGVTLAQWDVSPPSLTHTDFGARITLGDPLPDWGRTQAHDESITTNDQFDLGENVYRDVDDSGDITKNDVRITTVVAGGITYLPGSVVQPLDKDVTVPPTKLVVFQPGPPFTTAREMYVEKLPTDGVYKPGEAVYRDVDASATVSKDDIRITHAVAGGVTYAAGTTVGSTDKDVTVPAIGLARFPTSPHWHGTWMAGTMIGGGVIDPQWKGVAPAAQVRAYSLCHVWSCSDVLASLESDHLDAGAHSAIAAHPWGTVNGHCNQVPADDDCYDVMSHFYDARVSGRRSDGSPTGNPRFLVIASAGNVGHPERHTENPPANGKFDVGELIYVDSTGDGKVSVNDVKLGGGMGDAAEGDLLVDFAPDEKHTILESTDLVRRDRGAFDPGEAAYRDTDGSGTVTSGDIRLTEVVDGGTTYAAGTPVQPGEPELTGDTRHLRGFRLWQNLRIGNSAKNTLQVGAIATDAMFLPAFSSRGPTDDGRLKPDLVAPGTQNAGEGGITTTHTRNRYEHGSGTSFSVAAASGGVALLVERYKAACVAAGPSPEALKALLIHGAQDVVAEAPGALPGPDFASGYGRLRVKEAADLIAHHATRTLTPTGPTAADLQLTLGRMQPLRVTLVWSDPPWTPYTPPEARNLKNDLDLVLVGPDGTQHTPWVLDPSDPLQPAKRSTTAPAASIPDPDRDHRNTVEQVVVDDAQAGMWTIRVSVKSPLFDGRPQDYVLVSEALSPTASPCMATPAADVWMRDNASDVGAVPSSGAMYLGPDLWNRLAPDAATSHQNPEHGQPNYLYATVRNATAVPVKATAVQLWIAQASTGLSWPADFSYVGEIAVPNLGPSEVRQVGPLVWYPPAPVHSDHFCMYMRVLSPQDPITIAEGAGIWSNAQNSNNLAYRNLIIVDLNSSRTVTFLLRNTATAPATVDIILRVPAEFALDGGEVDVALSTQLERQWDSDGRRELRGVIALRDSTRRRDPPLPAPGGNRPGIPYRVFTGGAGEAILSGFRLRPRQAERVSLTFRSSDRRTASYDIDVLQRTGREVVGGIRYVVRTRRRP